MWIIGHTAFAYLSIKLIFVLTKRRLDPNLMIFIFIFANFIDTLHIGFLRNLLHNPLGTAIFSVFWLLFFEKCKVIRKGDFFVLLFAAGTHILTDVLFSEYLLLFPLNNMSYSIYGWNSPEHLIVGSVLVMVYMAVFYLSGDYYKLKDFVYKEKNKFTSDLTFKSIYNPSLFTFYLFIAFYLFTIAQFFLFILLKFPSLTMGVLYVWMFFITFAFFLCVITTLLISRRSGFNNSENQIMA
ncbi:MAG: hypothetical protein ACFFC7_00360 [Candidatus Hermodarchaeota archaeon]